ncbi:MAG: precorrin-6A reductase [Atopobiaceae bacterium]|nr:precorrin-6A reductase [Atopobiaceae bacterium]
MEVLVFGGTIEGRALVEWLDSRGRSVVACVTTDYGASLLPQSKNVARLCGPLSHEEKLDLLDRHDFCCIVDATHPYARHITKSVASLGEERGIDVVRVVREGGESDGPWDLVSDAVEAADLLATTRGKVLLTTGSKDLKTYVNGVPSAQERHYVRILPLADAVEHAARLGIPANHVIAMQGPFSKELNEALMRQLDIRHLVTKQSGASGGFDEKVKAAEACGVHVIVIDRPCEQGGSSLEEVKTLLKERYGL